MLLYFAEVGRAIGVKAVAVVNVCVVLQRLGGELVKTVAVLNVSVAFFAEVGRERS